MVGVEFVDDMQYEASVEDYVQLFGFCFVSHVFCAFLLYKRRDWYT